jgi:uncharacterized LabA/DUF88 family protein
MTVSSANRTALFIDGVNLYSTAKALGFDIDYKRLLKEFQSHGTLVRAFYYTAVTEDQEFSSVRPLLDWLDYNGFTVVTKPTKEFIDSNGHRKVKGNMDVELTVDAMELADRVDQIVLFSGGGDFRSLVEAVQRRGVRVTVVSTISSLSLSETSSGWRLTENRAMLLFNEGSFQAHWLGGCRSISVAGGARGRDLDIAAANKRSAADCS